MLAADRVKPDIARLLLDAGADADVVNCEGDTALKPARERGHAEVAALLTQGH